VSQKVINIGNIYRLIDAMTGLDELYILAGWGYRPKVSLVSLSGCNRWRDPISVENLSKITAKEFEEILGKTNPPLEAKYIGRLDSVTVSGVEYDIR